MSEVSNSISYNAYLKTKPRGFKTPVINSSEIIQQTKAWNNGSTPVRDAAMVNSFKVQQGTYTAHVFPIKIKRSLTSRHRPAIHSTATDRFHSVSSYRPIWMHHSFCYTIFCQWQSIKIWTHLLFESGNTNSDCLLQKEPTYKLNEKSLEGRNTVCSYSQNRHSVISTKAY